MKRTIDFSLNAWKKSEQRKVLLLRGARQIGKTYSVRQLGKSFKNICEVNFEEDRAVHGFFRDSLNPIAICEKISAYYSKPIVPGETLLFFDEIQACPDAISALRFFYEKMGALHVVAAGSLLEFAIADLASHGVGRIHSLFMFPMSFFEFLGALGAQPLADLIERAPLDRALDEAFHRKLIDLFKTYQLIGGMPEVVSTYVDTHDLLKCQGVLNDLLTALKDDFAKYKKRSPVLRLNEVFDAVVQQVGQKFMYSRVDTESSMPSVKVALDLLVQAGIVYKVYHSHARGIPLGAQMDSKKFKVLFFDTGIQQRVSGLRLSEYIAASDFDVINKGCLAECTVGLQLLVGATAEERPQLYYWHREGKGTNAEVDYVIQREERIIPIEVKAGTKGQMQSMFTFMNERGLQKGVRCSLENFSQYQNIQVLPLYAVSRITSL